MFEEVEPVRFLLGSDKDDGYYNEKIVFIQLFFNKCAKLPYVAHSKEMHLFLCEVAPFEKVLK